PAFPGAERRLALGDACGLGLRLCRELVELLRAAGKRCLARGEALLACADVVRRLLQAGSGLGALLCRSGQLAALLLEVRDPRLDLALAPPGFQLALFEFLLRGLVRG